jgi:YD repeat-containing protein
MRIITITTALLYLACCNLFGQLNPPKLAPPTPEVAGFAKYGDIPVGHYTGTPDISIPLYTIEESGLQVPIVLRYHASGILVEQESTWVGLGFDLTVGGGITRITQGEWDGFDNITSIASEYNTLFDTLGYLKFTHNVRGEYGDLWACATTLYPKQDSRWVMEKVTGYGYGRPDIYQYSFLNHSGKYVIDQKTKKPYILKKEEELDFVSVDYGSGSDWTMRTSDGVKYNFGPVEESRDTGLPAYHVSPSYTKKLNQIRMLNGQNIDFSYTNGYYENCNCSESNTFGYQQLISGGGVIVPPPMLPTIQNQPRLLSTTTQYLSQITGTNVIVVFDLSDREDIAGTKVAGGTYSAKKLDRIRIIDKSKNQLIKSFEFKYDYFLYTPSIGGGDYTELPFSNCHFTADRKGKRLKLVSLQEIGHDINGNNDFAKSPYGFEYNESIKLPLKTSYARDYWGYYNGEQNNTTLLPEIKAAYGRRNTDLDKYINHIWAPDRANRGASKVYSQAAILTKVKYPTGGVTDFEYESHEFKNEIAPSAEDVRNWYSNVINLADYNTVTQVSESQLIYPKPGIDLLFWFDKIYFTRGTQSNLRFEDFVGSKITIWGFKNSTGWVSIKDYIIPNTNDAKVTFNAQNGYEFTHEKQLVPFSDNYEKFKVSVSLPDGIVPDPNTPSASVQCSFRYLYQDRFATETFYGAGLRIKNITSSERGIPTKKTSYSYTLADNTTSGLMMSPLSFITHKETNRCFQGCTPEHPPSPTSIQLDGYEWYIASESYVPLSGSANGQQVGYSLVTEQPIDHYATVASLDDTPTNGRTKFYFSNAIDQTIQWANLAIPAIQSYRNGLLEKKEIFTMLQATPIVTEEYTYRTLQKHESWGVVGTTNFFGDDICNPCNGAVNFCAGSVGGKFKLVFYPVITEWNVLNRKAITYRIAGMTNSPDLITSTLYGYNQFGLVSSEEMTNSDQSVSRTEKKYSFDFSNNEYGATLLKNYFINSAPVMEARYLNGKKIYQHENYYESISNSQSTLYNWGNPTKVVTLPNGTIEGTTSQYLTYDPSFGTLIKSRQDDNFETHYIWGHNKTRVVAVIKNATGASISTALGNDVNLLTGGLTASQESALRLIGQAQVLTFYHDVLRGVTEMHDVNGFPTTYQYDAYGRLNLIKDINQNILKRIEYNYQLR